MEVPLQAQHTPDGSAQGDQDAVVDLGQVTHVILEAICIGLEELEDVLNARATCSSLSQPASDCISSLLADIANSALPAEAWRVYRRAMSLIIRPLADRYALDFSMMRTSDLTEPEFKHRLRELKDQIDHLIATLAALPEQVDVVTSEGEDAAYLPTTTEQSMALARALSGSRCAASLQVLHLQFCMSALAADVLAAGLPALRDLKLSLGSMAAWGGQGWAPSALPRHLSSLSLHHPPVCKPFKIDMRALAAATSLQCLALCGKLELVNPDGLAQLTGLTKLSLDKQPAGSVGSGAASTELWELLGKLPQLQHLSMQDAAVEVPQRGGWRLPALTHFHAHLLTLRAPEERLRGCLTTAMPALEDFACESTTAALEVVQGLRGHWGIQALRLGDYGAVGQLTQAAAGPALGSLAELTSLDFWSRHPCNAHAMLAAAGGCGALRSLKVVNSCSAMAARLAAGEEAGVDLAGLAAGAAGRRLRRLYLKGGGCTLAALAALLAGADSGSSGGSDSDSNSGSGPSSSAPELESVTLGSRYQPWVLLPDQRELAAAAAGGKPAEATLQMARQYAASSELVRALVLAATEAAAMAAAAAAEVLGEAAAMAAAEAAAELPPIDDAEAEAEVEAVLQFLAARLCGFGAGAHLVSEDEVEELLAGVSKALRLRLMLMARLRQQRGVRLELELQVYGVEITVFM